MHIHVCINTYVYVYVYMYVCICMYKGRTGGLDGQMRGMDGRAVSFRPFPPSFPTSFSFKKRRKGMEEGVERRRGGKGQDRTGREGRGQDGTR
jgi:hypothetical protein